MTRVCLIGTADCNLQYELLSRETSRDALSTYDLERPFENSLALRTVSVGAAVSLLNDLNWYLTRFVDEALVQEPSVDDEEWLSRDLAKALRNGTVDPADTAEFCKIYGLERAGPAGPESSAISAANERDERDDDSSEPGRNGSSGNDGSEDDENGARPGVDTSWRLVEPLYVRRTDGDLPEYDLRDVERTLVVRLTEAEHSP